MKVHENKQEQQQAKVQKSTGWQKRRKKKKQQEQTEGEGKFFKKATKKSPQNKAQIRASFQNASLVKKISYFFLH